MSRSNWLYDFAFRGCLTAGLLWAGLAYAQEGTNPALENQPVPESGQHTSKGGAADQGQQTEPTPGKISPALNQIEAAIRDLIAQERTAQGQGPKDEEIRDLKAQEGMALWAEAMFWATGAAVILTFAGIVLIRYTLKYTKIAAGHTEEMLNEARKTTKAAEETVVVTRESTERQLRAYVHIKEGKRHDDGDKPRFILTAHNTGQTPAHDVTFWILIVTATQEGDPPAPLVKQPGRFPMGPEGELVHRARISDGLPDDIWDSIKSGDKAIFIHGEITYTDSFGVNRWTRFRYKYGRGEIGSNEIILCESGNEAN